MSLKDKSCLYLFKIGDNTYFDRKLVTKRIMSLISNFLIKSYIHKVCYEHV